MEELIIILAVISAAAGLRAFRASWCQRLGMSGYVVATGMIGYFLAQAWWGGVLGVMVFLFAPMLGIFWKIRDIRLPLERKLRSALPPNDSQFPTLTELTAEFEAHHYELIDDVQTRWLESREQMRLLRHPQDKVVATISMITEGEFQMLWVSLFVKSATGRILSTTTIPFMNPLQTAPGVSVRYARQAQSVADLIREHRQHQGEKKIYTDELIIIDSEEATTFLETEMRRQVDHNLDLGVIQLAGEGTFSYSWRGGVFLWYQWLKSVWA
jgi:hypothetical protein